MNTKKITFTKSEVLSMLTELNLVVQTIKNLGYDYLGEQLHTLENAYQKTKTITFTRTEILSMLSEINFVILTMKDLGYDYFREQLHSFDTAYEKLHDAYFG